MSVDKAMRPTSQRKVDVRTAVNEPGGIRICPPFSQNYPRIQIQWLFLLAGGWTGYIAGVSLSSPLLSSSGLDLTLLN